MLVFPDADRRWQGRLAQSVRAPTTISHPSGRPWVVDPPSADVTVARAGLVAVAVIGSVPVTATRLGELAERVRTLNDVDAIARSLPGSFHLLASVCGQVRVQGSLSGLRRVFHGWLDGTPVASDEAETLVRLVDASVCEEALAIRVACGIVPPPLGERSMWSGIQTVPPDHYLALDQERGQQRCWWTPPEPRVSLGHGARRLRHTLDEAVEHRRARRGRRLGADLSGGLDSSSLCLLAAGHTPDLLTLRWAEAEQGNDDAHFASQAAQRLQHAEHLIVPQRELPSIYADPADALADLEQPYPFARTAARAEGTVRLLAEHGVGRHLAGHGGDEVFAASPAHLHRTLRRRPITALGYVRAYRALYRWPLGATVTGLLRSGDVAGWWQAMAGDLDGPPSSHRAPMLGWGIMRLRTPPWATSAAVAAARAALRQTADTARPLGHDQGQHQHLLKVRTTAGGYRQLARLFARHGVQLELPYLDDRVVEAALAVRGHEQANPWRYKPLLTEAMRGVLPPALLTRSTKGEFGQDVRDGLRRNRKAVLDVFGDSALAARGLIDTDVLRNRLLAPQPDNAVIMALEQLLGCETWLRAAG